ncbi:GDSL-type esterase/lipase family protein [Kocuria sp. HSID16901]|uniref:GDSL-type esterase/lipase family protein n=1 Tax=Kocuria sp. HSID16901 TaxID=2419505 RepID=UPI00065FD3FE|nr:GDSL-type esterase/lipase family protein [Kocuria sp. HSID16901]RUQ21772.1 hypothetical protein D8M21_05625 [Kocuria sp. HSID16901]
MQKLFSYGTLQNPAVQSSLWGGTVPTSPANLPGFSVQQLTITDPDVVKLSGSKQHPSLVRSIGESVDGVVLELDDEQLAAADRYEVADYARREVLLADGTHCWAYVPARPLAAAQRVVLGGDSIAYGQHDPEGGWAHRLATELEFYSYPDRRMFNLAIPGIFLTQLAEQLPGELPWRRPDTVLIAAGVNDVARPLDGPQPNPDLEAALDTLNEACRELGARMVVLSPIWLDETRRKTVGGMQSTVRAVHNVVERQRTWCEERNVDFIDAWEALQDRPDLLGDGLHPNAAGHAHLYEYLRDRL